MTETETTPTRNQEIRKGRKYTLVGNGLMEKYDVEEDMRFVGTDQHDKRFFHFARKGRAKKSPIELITIKGSDIESIEDGKINLNLGYVTVCPIDEHDMLYEECLDALALALGRRRR